MENKSEIGYEKKADVAWVKLRARLEQEKLLPTTSKSTKKIIPFLVAGASAAVIIIGLILSIFDFNSNKEEINDKLIYNQSNTSSLVCVMEDKSVIYLSNNSTISYPEIFKQNSRDVKLTGQAFFDIASEPDRPFKIETQLVEVEVLGTAFSINSSDTLFNLAVARGKVRVEFKNMSKNKTEKIIIDKGERIQINNKGYTINKIAESKVYENFFKTLKFKDETLENVLEVLSATTYKKVSAATNVKKLLLTIEISPLDSNAINLITSALDLKIRKKGETTELYK